MYICAHVRGQHTTWIRSRNPKLHHGSDVVDQEVRTQCNTESQTSDGTQVCAPKATERERERE